jgi:isoleucyl-tRNA synthetase
VKFKVQDKKTYAQLEHEIIDFWKKDDTFKKSVENRTPDNGYVFYDGPPFITGVPHAGTLLSSIAKDAIPRYWTMHGKHVERVWGWDCHGLPAENFVEKKLGIKDKRDVFKIGLKKYIETCRELMVQTGNEWEEYVERIGRWVDFEGAYKTMDKPYMESIWWAFKQLYDKGKIYVGE